MLRVSGSSGFAWRSSFPGFQSLRIGPHAGADHAPASKRLLFPVGSDEEVAADLADVGVPAERHREVELLAQDREALRDARLAERADSVDEGAPDEDAFRAERHGLEKALAGIDAAIHPHLDA